MQYEDMLGLRGLHVICKSAFRHVLDLPNRVGRAHVWRPISPRVRVLMGVAMAAPYAVTRTPWTVVTWLKGAVWTAAPCWVSQASTWASGSRGSPRAAAQWAYAI
jgi:hypothetical protein